MFELSGVNYEEVLEQGDSILVCEFELPGLRVTRASSYRGFELPGLRVTGASSYRGFELPGLRVIGIILYFLSGDILWFLLCGNCRPVHKRDRCGDIVW